MVLGQLEMHVQNSELTPHTSHCTQKLKWVKDLNVN